MFTPGSVLILCLNFYVEEDGSYYTQTVLNNCLPLKKFLLTGLDGFGEHEMVNIISQEDSDQHG